VKRREPAEREAALRRYRSLVERYHDTLDLVSDRALDRWDQHVAEAEAYVDALCRLSPAPSRVLDVGSGVGLPGVVVAAHLPDLALELVERRRKRAAFLRMAVAAVGSRGAAVRMGDAGDVSGPPVDVVTAQAVAHLREVYRVTAHRHAESVVFIARKGPEAREEVQELEARIGTGATVLAAEARPERGTLLVVRTQGGLTCRSSA
jgi:16S rRNA (guanine527-N7)-methyltransferase